MEDQRIFEEQFIIPLLTRYVRGEELTSLELKTIEIWIDRSEANRAVYLELVDNEILAKNLVDFGKLNATTEERLKKLHGRLKKSQSHYKRVVIWTSAAAVLLFFSLSLLLYRNYQSRNAINETVKTAAADVDPGKDQATLTFGDGKTVALNGKDLKTDQNGTSFLGDQAISENANLTATLSTPRKGQYKTTLPDGTKVWLNAESELKFPTQFTTNERLVELKGEGYFEVAHNASKPFIVISKGQRVKVLGTKFNINSYNNEETTKTTLISGSVELSNEKNTASIKLKPGQQGKLSQSKFTTEFVDTDIFTAWTTNEFQFEGAPLVEVLRQLERWYDVDVDYSNIPNVSVHGTISRQKKLSSVLYTLEKITDLKFQLTNERRLKIIR
ncbi:FecR family protein [Sphingobacterium siyangense]|uniref:FecR family protein n=1 Tax=Sphingobacterium siyangense TaxID=459529 RepID=UPI0019640910|nr:FecR family protein [Sphingobacterium siyangense]QRY55940.1 FecR domain-containing protein [Sphingobacterium siyangense]